MLFSGSCAWFCCAPLQCLLLGTRPRIRLAAPQPGSGRRTAAPTPRGSAGAPGVGSRGAAPQGVTGDGRSGPGSGTAPAAGGSFGAVPLQRQADSLPTERLAEPELPSAQAQLGDVKMQREELMLQVKLTSILWVYFISSSLMLA